MDRRERGAGWVRLGPVRSSAAPCAALGFWCIYRSLGLPARHSWLASQARDWTDTVGCHWRRARYLSLETMQNGYDAVNLLSSAEVRSQSGRRDRLDLTGVGVVELMIVASSPRR